MNDSSSRLFMPAFCLNMGFLKHLNVKKSRTAAKPRLLRLELAVSNAKSFEVDPSRRPGHSGIPQRGINLDASIITHKSYNCRNQHPVMPEYGKKTVVELTEILKRRSLPHTGKKAELIARLNEADKAEGPKTSRSRSL